MKADNKKALIATLIISLVVFMIYFITYWLKTGFFFGLGTGIIGAIMFGTFAFFAGRALIRLSGKVSFKWWQWIFYVFGWFTGFLNLLFWAIVIILHFTNDKGLPFFNKKFHERVLVWGMVTGGLVILSYMFKLLNNFLQV